ncbi:hypothetical protein DL766_004633 [Monosporascus sp. MC13-8B]|nr:hypothetical protein DL766_004633 [Monosporascus sp. MC13-8B]
MAPSKAQPPPPPPPPQQQQQQQHHHHQQVKTKTASGHDAKKQTATASTTASRAARPVVFPAIPLPLMQKQSVKSPKSPAGQNKHAPSAGNSSNGLPAPSLDAALIDQVVAPNGVKSQHPQSAKSSENEVNGSNVEKPEHATTTQNNAVTVTVTTATTAVNGANGSRDTRAHPHATNGINVASQENAVAAQQSSAPSMKEADSSTADSTSAPAVAMKTGNTIPQMQSLHLYAEHGRLQTIDTQDARPHKSQIESDVFPRRFGEPRALNSQAHPLQHHQPTDRHPDHLAFQSGAHMHRHHMSNGGGIMFGGFPESHTPSPAPHPGGFMPPATMPINGENSNFSPINGHHHAQSNSNGFPAAAAAAPPINTQYHPDMVPVSSIDTYGPIPAHVPPRHFEAFPPGASRYGPPTPHSFHGSHTSGEPNSLEHMQFPPRNMHYPGHAHQEQPAGHHHPHHPQHHHPPAPFPPFLPSQAFTRRPSVEGELVESIAYFRNQFDNGELADCVLELVYTNGRHHPVKISGHKLILAQSPALKHYIMSARTAESSGSHTITIESDDSYLRSDAWWMAVQRLYLHPLLNIPPIIGNGANGMDFAGDKTDRFEFCLGYAAAGHLLEMRDTLVRGLQIAADLLNWATVEDALGFVLEGTTQRHTDFAFEDDGTNFSFVDLEYGYGPETKILMDAVMSFLINAFPSNFELDPTVSDPPKYARIPAIPGAPPVPSPRGSLPPAIARGTNARNSGKPVRLGSIKFGDLPPAFPEDGSAPRREPAKCSPVLSRILLNLPFDQLRTVLASESNSTSCWNTAQDRYHAVAGVVAAREAKRLRAVDAVRAGAIPNALDVQKRLSTQRRHAVVQPWDVLNWQEEVAQPRGAEVPRLVRKWIPQFPVTHEMELQRQAPAPAYDVPESMV